jgi:hypothetical protein
MNRRIATYQRLTRVAEFANGNVGSFPKDSIASDLLETIASGVQTLQEENLNQLSAEALMRTTLKAKTEARETLKSHLLAAAELSRALGSEDLKMPRNANVPNLISAGRHFAVVARAMKKELLEHALPPKFAEDIAAATDELERADQEYLTAKRLRSGALGRWDDAVRPLMNVLQRLDALAHNALKDNPVALASYERARALSRKKSTKEEAPPADPSKAASTAA